MTTLLLTLLIITALFGLGFALVVYGNRKDEEEYVPLDLLLTEEDSP